MDNPFSLFNEFFSLDASAYKAFMHVTFVIAVLIVFSIFAYLALWCWLFRSLYFCIIMMYYQIRLGDAFFESRRQDPFETPRYFVSKRFRQNWFFAWPLAYVIRSLCSLRSLEWGNSRLDLHSGLLSIDFKQVWPRLLVSDSIKTRLGGAQQ